MRKYILLFLIFLVPAPLHANCDASHSQWDSDQGIREFFESCLRVQKPSEQYLYTFGHKDKFERLFNGGGYTEFAQFNVPQQDAYSGIKARSLLIAISENIEHRASFINQLKATIGVTSVRKLQQLSNDPYFLIDLQNKWYRISNPEANSPPRVNLKPLLRNNKIDTKLTKDKCPQALAGLWALALDKTYPGFLEDLPFTIDKLIVDVKSEIQGDPENDIEPATRIRLRELQGRLLGFTRAKKPGKPSNISYGPAVYLGPLEKAIGYYYDADHMGYVCKLTDEAQIVDLTDPGESSDTQHEVVRPQKILLDNNVFLKELGNSNKIGLFPFGYNQFSNPQHIRFAMYDYIVKFGDVYADNGVVEYDQSNTCKKVTLDDFNTCGKVKSLLSQGYFYGNQNKPRPMYDYFLEELDTKESKDKSLGDLNTLITKCAASIVPTAERICAELNDSKFINSTFNKENVVLFDSLRNDACKQ